MPVRPTPWYLGIDFGTSFTVVAASRDGAATVVDVESNGSSRMPSSVFFTQDEEFLVGTAALHQSVFSPERFEPTPKRAIGEGEVFLGDRLVPVVDLVSAVLRRVYAEACRQQGETVPATVCVTHPADWSATRLNVLREAIEKAGIGTATLVPEPVAAATRFAMATPIGSNIAVYDFGGGTMDAAVLTRTEEDFVVAGQPAGRDPLGGEDIDRRIIDYVGTLVGEDDEAWLALLNAEDTKERHNAATLRAEVRRAKETLSEVSACQLWLPGLERAIQLTRVELDGLIGADVDATVDTLQRALEDARVAPPDLAGIYLIGGSSRIPLVADTIWRRLEVRPVVQDNPKSVVALGASGWTRESRDTGLSVSARRSKSPAPPPPPPPAIPVPVVAPPGAGRVGVPAVPAAAPVAPTPRPAAPAERVRTAPASPKPPAPAAKPPTTAAPASRPGAAAARAAATMPTVSAPRRQPASPPASRAHGPAAAPPPTSPPVSASPPAPRPSPPAPSRTPAAAASPPYQITESPSSYVVTLRRSWRLDLPPHLEPFELVELKPALGSTVDLGQVIGRARSTTAENAAIWEIRASCAGKVWHTAASTGGTVRLDEPLFQVAPLTAYTIDGPRPHPAGPGGMALSVTRAGPADPALSLALEFLNRRFFVWPNASFFFPAIAGTHVVRLQAYRGPTGVFSKSTGVLVRPGANTALVFEISGQQGRFR